MELSVLATKIGKLAKVNQLSKNEYEIITGAKINQNTNIVLYLSENNGNFYLSDHKSTLKFMAQMYELKSIDVKNCISSVIKIYGYNIISGEIFAKIKSEFNVIETYYSFIMCVGQLVNMYAFFDKP